MTHPRVAGPHTHGSLVRLVVSLVCLSVAGCAEAPAVKRFAAASASAGEKFPEIANDIEESCERREKYRLLGRWGADLDSLEEVTALTCAEYGRAVSRLSGAHRVLIGYMKALGNLSAGEIVSYDNPVDDLGDAVVGISGADAKSVAAVKGVSEVLAEAVAGKWRNKQMSTVIERTNADVQALVTALCETIEGDYGRLLDAESEAARKFYLGLIKEYRGEEPLTAVLVYDRWLGEERAIEARRETARSYVKVLHKIGRGHQDLFNHRDALKSKDVRKLVLKHSTAIEDLAADLGDAF